MPTRLETAISAIDSAHGGDPNRIGADANSEAKELSYAREMTAWLFRLEENPSEILQLAARAQHICRWQIARSSFPPGRIGYLQWRTALYSHHAEVAGNILTQVGYDSASIERVQRLLRKQGIKSDPEMQTLEDVACLVFLKNELAAFMQRQPEEKVIEILRKTWRKMSPRGQAVALEMAPTLSEPVREAVNRALRQG